MIAAAVSIAIPTAASAASSEPSAAAAPQSTESEFFAGYDGYDAKGQGSDGIKVTLIAPDFTCAAGEESSTKMVMTAGGYSFDFGDVVTGGGGLYATCQDGIKIFRTVLFVANEGLERVVDGPVESGDRLQFVYDAINSRQSVGSVKNLDAGWSGTTGKYGTPFVPTSYGSVGAFPRAYFGGSPPLVNAASYDFGKVNIDGTRLKKGQWEPVTLVDLRRDPLLEPTAVRRGNFRLNAV